MSIVSPESSSRRGYAVAALVFSLAEVAIALWLDDRLIRPYVGDSLAVMLVYCLFRTVTPLPVVAAVLAALTVAFAIEFAQACHVVEAIGLGDVAVARTVLGTHFDPSDLVAYIVGGLLILGAEAVRPIGPWTKAS